MPPLDSNSSLPSTGKYGAADWESTRKAFAHSIMVDTSLHSLAQNLDMPDWPIRGAAETPAKYVDLGYEELIAMPGISGRPERVDQLVAILKETLAFDEPFGEMISEADPGAVERDNPLLKNLAKLGIPENFPMPLVALTAETREFCQLEKLATLKEFAIFSQNLSQSLIVGGDFRALLNALSHIDEKTIARHLPFRPGAKGLHLLEGIALGVRAYPVDCQAAVALRLDPTAGSELAKQAATAGAKSVDEAVTTLTQQTGSYVEFFQGDLARLQLQINEGVPLARLATVLGDPVVEAAVAALLKPHLRPPAVATQFEHTAAPVVAAARSPKKGFFASLFQRFRK